MTKRDKANLKHWLSLCEKYVLGFGFYLIQRYVGLRFDGTRIAPPPQHVIILILLHGPARGVRGIFFWGGKVIFPDFFPGLKCFIPEGNSHFGRPKTNFSCFEKWKEKKEKKKRSPPHFVTFLLPLFQFSTFPFSIFLLFCSIFPCLYFSGRSAEISRSEVSGGGGHSAPPPPPPACYATGSGHAVTGLSQDKVINDG